MSLKEELKSAKNYYYDDPKNLVFTLGEVEGFYYGDIDRAMSLTPQEREEIVEAWCVSLSKFTDKERDKNITSLVNEVVYQVRNKRSKKSIESY